MAIMGRHTLVTLATIIAVVAVGISKSTLHLPEYYNLRGGTFYGSFSSPLYQQYRYGLGGGGYGYGYPKGPFLSYSPKAIPAQLPVSETFDIEIMKPMSQFPEKKSVPLFIVPQNSLHVFPHVQKLPVSKFQSVSTSTTTFHRQIKYDITQLTQFMNDPTHLPAIEIPLEEPMIVGTVSTDVLAPTGFNVLLNGPYVTSYPIYTVALLAPVPVGTIVSKETPVILTTIYAIPNLPTVPSYYPVLAQFPTKMIGPSKGTTTKIEQSVKNTFISSSSNSISSSTEKTTVLPVSHDIFVGVAYPETSFPSSVPTPPTTTIFAESIRDENDAVSPAGIISGTAPEFTPKPFVNSKESPYLRELREQSLRSQIAELQQLLNDLTSTRVDYNS